MCQKTETEITLLTHMLDYHEDLRLLLYNQGRKKHILILRVFLVLPYPIISINGQLQESWSNKDKITESPTPFNEVWVTPPGKL